MNEKIKIKLRLMLSIVTIFKYSNICFLNIIFIKYKLKRISSIYIVIIKQMKCFRQAFKIVTMTRL